MFLIYSYTSITVDMQHKLIIVCKHLHDQTHFLTMYWHKFASYRRIILVLINIITLFYEGLNILSLFPISQDAKKVVSWIRYKFILSSSSLHNFLFVSADTFETTQTLQEASIWILSQNKVLQCEEELSQSINLQHIIRTLIGSFQAIKIWHQVQSANSRQLCKSGPPGVTAAPIILMVMVGVLQQPVGDMICNVSDY